MNISIVGFLCQTADYNDLKCLYACSLNARKFKHEINAHASLTSTSFFDLLSKWLHFFS